MKADSELAEKVNTTYAVLKEIEKPKYLPSQVVQKMKEEGFPNFSIHYHTQLWKSLDAQNESKGFGCFVVDKWHWYERWVEEVRNHCIENKNKFQ